MVARSSQSPVTRLCIRIPSPSPMSPAGWAGSCRMLPCGVGCARPGPSVLGYSIGARASPRCRPFSARVSPASDARETSRCGVTGSVRVAAWRQAVVRRAPSIPHDAAQTGPDGFDLDRLHLNGRWPYRCRIVSQRNRRVRSAVACLPSPGRIAAAPSFPVIAASVRPTLGDRSVRLPSTGDACARPCDVDVCTGPRSNSRR